MRTLRVYGTIVQLGVYIIYMYTNRLLLHSIALGFSWRVLLFIDIGLCVYDAQIRPSTIPFIWFTYNERLSSALHGTATASPAGRVMLG